MEPQLESEDGDDPFAREVDADQEVDLPEQAVAWLREELDLPTAPALPGLGPALASSSASSSMLLPFSV